jgi:hypothetical protein
MQDFPDIISTDIIPEKWNTIWEENDEVNALGNRPILIITLRYKPGSEESVQLQKIVEACKIKEEQYNLLTIGENQVISINYLFAKCKPETVLFLGIQPIQLGISAQFALNKPNKFNNSIFIPALSLSDMEQQPQMKARLWNDALKPIFIENK